MKLTLNKIFLLLICIFSLPMSSYQLIENPWFEELRIEPIKIKEVTRIPQSVVIGMIQVESNGNDKAYNKSEEAVGCLQIRPIMVREVNRILKIQGEDYRFKMKDRWDRKKSLEMFWVWKDYHHPNSTNEVIARNWNGGPNGYKIKSTEKYWEKVNRCLEER